MMIWKQPWIWRERGWDNEDDGYSLHLYYTDATDFIREYWDKMPDEVPDEYSCPWGMPFQVPEEDIDPAILDALRKSRNGVKV